MVKKTGWQYWETARDKSIFGGVSCSIVEKIKFLTSRQQLCHSFVGRGHKGRIVHVSEMRERDSIRESGISSKKITRKRGRKCNRRGSRLIKFS
jgi:hypothetical protein